MNFKKLFLTLAVIAVTCAMCAADSGTRLRCRVFDSGKALISGAKLTLKNGAFAAVGHTNDEGEYAFVNVPPGPYHLTVEKEGFAPADINAVVLDLNEVRVLSVTLPPKEHTEVVDVTAGQVSVVPQQTFLRGLVDPLRMKELPLNGRNFSDLIYTQPGVTRDFSDNFAPPAQQITDPSFGVSSNQLLINNTQSRQIQFGLKVEF